MRDQVHKAQNFTQNFDANVDIFVYFFLRDKKIFFETVSRDEVTRRDEIETVSSRLAFFRDETVSLPALRSPLLPGQLLRRGDGEHDVASSSSCFNEAIEERVDDLYVGPSRSPFFMNMVSPLASPRLLSSPISIVPPCHDFDGGGKEGKVTNHPVVKEKGGGGGGRITRK